MSGSSAIASARRRRAGNDPPVPQYDNRRQVQQHGNNNIVQNQGQNQNQNQNQGQVQNVDSIRMTPLEILQHHSMQIKNLQDTLNENLDNIIASKVDKILENTKANTNTNANTNIETNIDEKITSILEEKLVSILEEKVAPIIEETMLELKTDYNNEIKRLDAENNNLKLLLIKSQTIILETSNDMIKIKDSFKDIEEEFSSLKQNSDNRGMGGIESLLNMFSQGQNQMCGNDDDNNSDTDIHNSGESINISSEEILIDESIIDSLEPGSSENTLGTIETVELSESVMSDEVINEVKNEIQNMNNIESIGNDEINESNNSN